MQIYNGGYTSLKDIEILSLDSFRAEVLRCCRGGGRLVNLFGSPENNGDVRLFALLGMDDDAALELVSAMVAAGESKYQALTPELPQAQSFEREIAEQWAIMPEGHPWLKPLRYHTNYRRVKDIWPGISAKTIPGEYQFFSFQGEEVHEVSVGPVHAGIIEPGHFRFQCHGEEIMHLEIQLGYQHRGIEPMFCGHDLRRGALLSEAIAGDTSIGHSLAFCEAIESLSACMLLPRAQAVRAVALELERLANHVGDLGALSLDAGFGPAGSFLGRMRGDYLNLLLALTGNRFGKGLCRPGGVTFDIPDKMAEDFCRKLKVYKKEFEDVSDLLFTRPSVLARFEEAGVLSAETARMLGLVGLAARASQVERDVRLEYSSGFWQYHHIPISLAATGDVYARALVRRMECLRSLDFLLKVIPSLPKGGVFTPICSLKPDSLAVSLVEGWRGEIVHVLITDEQGGIKRYKVKDPSFHNWPGLAMAVRNHEISDFPLCNKSFNLSYCGHDL